MDDCRIPKGSGHGSCGQKFKVRGGFLGVAAGRSKRFYFMLLQLMTWARADVSFDACRNLMAGFGHRDAGKEGNCEKIFKNWKGHHREVFRRVISKNS